MCLFKWVLMIFLESRVCFRGGEKVRDKVRDKAKDKAEFYLKILFYVMTTRFSGFNELFFYCRFTLFVYISTLSIYKLKSSKTIRLLH